jgi:FAD synthase
VVKNKTNIMDKTTYEQLLQQREKERFTKISSISVLHEIIKNLEADSIVTILKLTKYALSDVEFAERISQELGVTLENLSKIHEKSGACLRYIS